MQSIDGEIRGVNGNAQKEIYKWADGSVDMALGAEYRKEEANYKNNFALIRQAASSGLELAEDSSGDRDVTALLAEFNIPFLKTMELNLAVRWDDYSDVGSNVAPKVSYRWQATSNTLLRASYNQGFRAPTLYHIYSPNSITFTADARDDPVLCPEVTRPRCSRWQSRACMAAWTSCAGLAARLHCGRRPWGNAMLGSFEDALEMSKAVEGVEPCLDFAHLHARPGDGTMNTHEEWSKLLKAYQKALGKKAVKRLHIHLSGIEYGPKGEKNHLKLAEADLNLKALYQALLDFGCGGRILCESPIMEEDALIMKKAWMKISREKE